MSDSQLEEMMVESDYVTGESIPVSEQTAGIEARLNALQADVTELLTILRPLSGLIAAMPEAMEKIVPLIDGIKNSPVIKMLGIKL